MRRVATKLLIGLLLAPVVGVAQDKGAQSLEGVWRVDEAYDGSGATNTRPQPGLIIFSRKYFSIQVIESREPRPRLSPDASDRQRAEVFGQYGANAGTYEFVGDTLTLRRVVAKDPNIMQPGMFLVHGVTFEGADTVVLRARANQDGPIARGGGWKLRRVE